MKETRHYCDRCKSEIKYFFIKDQFPYMSMNENVFKDVTIKDETGIELNVTKGNSRISYELCHKCKKEFKKFMNAT